LFTLSLELDGVLDFQSLLLLLPSSSSWPFIQSAVGVELDVSKATIDDDVTQLTF